MHISNAFTSAEMTAKEVARNRFATLLLFVIPALYFILVWLTSGDEPVAFRLGTLSEEVLIEVGARDQSMVFIGVAAVGLVASFLALTLIQKNSDATRRLILCGFHPAELLIGKLLVLLVVIVLISIYVAGLMSAFFSPKHFALLAVGFSLSGFVHSCYGLLVGATVKGELNGILLIVLLVNIDAGWLQNPVFFSAAHNRAVIRLLPAYSPSQASVIAAFTDHSILYSTAASLFYGSFLLVVATGIFFWRMRINKKYGRI